MSLFLRGAAHDVAARLLVRLELEQPARLRLLEQLAERAESVVGLVEPGLAALERLLDHRAPDLLLGAALAHQRLDRLHHQVERLLALVLLAVARRRRLLLAAAHAPALLLLLA